MFGMKKLENENEKLRKENAEYKKLCQKKQQEISRYNVTCEFLKEDLKKAELRAEIRDDKLRTENEMLKKQLEEKEKEISTLREENSRLFNVAKKSKKNS